MDEEGGSDGEDDGEVRIYCPQEDEDDGVVRNYCPLLFISCDESTD